MFVKDEKNEEINVLCYCLKRRDEVKSFEILDHRIFETVLTPKELFFNKKNLWLLVLCIGIHALWSSEWFIIQSSSVFPLFAHMRAGKVQFSGGFYRAINTEEAYEHCTLKKNGFANGPI